MFSSHMNFCIINEQRLLLFQDLLRFLFGGRIPFIPINPHATVSKRAWNFSSPVRKNALDTPLKKRKLAFVSFTTECTTLRMTTDIN